MWMDSETRQQIERQKADDQARMFFEGLKAKAISDKEKREKGATGLNSSLGMSKTEVKEDGERT